MLKKFVSTKLSEPGFTKEHTLITKGILVIMLLAHHVFYPDNISFYGIHTIIDDYELQNDIIFFLKICISGFAFLTAYGMCRKYIRIGEDKREFLHISVVRLIKLEASVIFIYFAAVIYKKFVMGESISFLYIGEERNIFKLLVYMCVDMLGLAEFAGIVRMNITWWYLSLFIVLIAILPFIFLIYKKYRYLCLPVFLLMPFLAINSLREVLPSVCLGIAFSYENWFEKLGNKKVKNKFIGLVISLCIFYLAYLLRPFANMMFTYTLAFIIPYMVYDVISYIPVISHCLKFLGKHSMNIFLTHTFIYLYFHPDFIYSFRNSWTILSVLLGLSLLVSIVIEIFKKITGYNKLVSKLIALVDDKWAEIHKGETMDADHRNIKAG